MESETLGGVSQPHGYTFRQGAKALVRSAGRVLLVKERHADGSEFWTLPGGESRPDESITATLHREVAEELCGRIAVERRRGSFWYTHVSSENTITHYSVFECTTETPTVPNRTEGIHGQRWARPDAPPATTLLGVRCLLDNRC